MIPITSFVSTVVEKVYVKPNDLAKEGDILLELRKDELVSTLKKEEFSLDLAKRKQILLKDDQNHPEIIEKSVSFIVSTLNFYHTSKRAEDLVRGFHGLGGDLITISIQDEDISLKDLSFLAFYFPKISYQITTQGEIKYLRKFRKVPIVGIETGYRDVAAVKIEKGRFFNLGDIKEKRRVCLVNVNGENERFLVSTAEGLEKMVRQLKSTARTVTLGVGFLTFLLAGAGIVNLTMLSVRQRYKEIGIMRACGARRQDIFYLFLLEGSLLSFYGLWSGSVVGGIYVTLFGGCRFSLFIEAWLWSSIICMGSSICGYFPASAAANVSPCEAIRDADR